MATKTTVRSKKLARSIAKHFKHHAELPQRLDKYLMMYSGFYKAKASELIAAPE